MSKKVFLRKSYADVVKNSCDNIGQFDAKSNDDVQDEWDMEAVPGECFIKPKLLGFPYNRLSASPKSSQETKSSPWKKTKSSKFSVQQLPKASNIKATPDKMHSYDLTASSPIVISSPDTPSRSSPVQPVRSSPRKNLNKRRASCTQASYSSDQCSGTDRLSLSTEIVSSSDDSPDMPVIKRRRARIVTHSPVIISDEEINIVKTEMISPVKRKLFHETSDCLITKTDNSYGDFPSDPGSDEFLECYENDRTMPIYKDLASGMKTKEAVNLLMRKHKPEHLAKNIPLDIHQNVSFVFSIASIGHYKNALCDGMGRWDQTGKERTLFNILDGRGVQKASQNKVSDLSVRAVRRKYINSSYQRLHRIVITLEDPNNDVILDQMFVQYYFIGNETRIKVDPHGNSKSEKTYQRTSETTKQRIQELCGSSTKSKPKEVFHTLIEEQGGLHKVKSGAHIARDRQQVRNYNRKETHMLDPIVECSDLAKLQEKKGSRFLRDVRCAPEFTMFMSTDRQLNEINKFCTDEKCLSVLGVDTTFNIGHYYITITTYRNMMLLNSFGVEPVMIGPILLHQRKSFDSYFKLSSTILQDCPSLKNLKVFGTDGDVNLGNAFQVCFTNSVHLLCDIHMVDNIERKLSSLNIKGNTAKEYIHDIFGSGKGSVKVKGLVDCSSESEMDGKMDTFKLDWKSRHENGQAFLEYFLENKLDLIKQCMSAEIRSACGLGFPPKPYTQNANECINAVIKADIFSGRKDSKNLDPYDFVRIAETTVKRQENEVKLALIGKGEYRLKSAYQHLAVKEEEYWKKTEVQREAVFKRMQNEPLANVNSQHTSTDPVPNLMREVSEEVQDIKSVPLRILNDIFHEASCLISDPGNIVPLPGTKDGNMYIVANKEKPTDPFKIKYAPTTQAVSCEKKCTRYSGFKVCQHCVAVAHRRDVLRPFLKKFAKVKEQTHSLSELANANMPAHRGKKRNESTQKRKGRFSKTSSNFLFYEEPATSSENHQRSEQPLHLTFMAGLIKKCYGCDQLFQKKYRTPPYDILLKRFDYRTYISPNSKTKKRSHTLQNTYFHLNKECVRRVCPTFEMQDVIVHQEIKEQLTEDHKNVIRKVGIHA